MSRIRRERPGGPAALIEQEFALGYLWRSARRTTRGHRWIRVDPNARPTTSVGVRIAALEQRVAMCLSGWDNLGTWAPGATSGSTRFGGREPFGFTTCRVPRLPGYAGYPFWCVIAALAGHWQLALAGEELFGALAAAASMWAAAKRTNQRLLLVPLRDLFGFAVWCGGIAGSTVEWRSYFHLRRDGRQRDTVDLDFEVAAANTNGGNPLNSAGAAPKNSV